MKAVAVCSSTTSGGAEHYLRLLLAGLHDRGHDVALLGGIPDWSLPAIPADIGDKWSMKRPLRSLVQAPQGRRAVAQSARLSAANVFHCQFKREQISFTDILARTAPVVWTEHGVFHRHVMSRALAVAYGRAARNVHAIICVTSRVRDDVASVCPPGTRLVVIPNAVNTAALLPADQEQKAQARTALGFGATTAPVVAWVGRLHEGKMPLLAMEVARRLPGILALAGDGPMALSVGAEASKLTNVRYLGPLAESSVLLRAADALLFTSNGRGEGMPLTILEAASHGLPIVVNAEACIDVPDHVAITAPALHLAEALTEALSKDATAKHAIRAWAVQNHDLHQWLDAHEAVFASAVRS